MGVGRGRVVVAVDEPAVVPVVGVVADSTVVGCVPMARLADVAFGRLTVDG